MEDIEILKDVIEHMGKGTQVGAFLYEMAYGKDEGSDELRVSNQLEINKQITGACNPVFRITKTNVYLDLDFEYENDATLKSLMYMWQEYLDKQTSAITLNRLLRDYSLIFTVYNRVDGFTYMYECFNPIFMCRDNGVIHAVFDINSLTFGRDELDYSVQDKEIKAEEDLYASEIEKMENKIKELDADEVE